MKRKATRILEVGMLELLAYSRNKILAFEAYMFNFEGLQHDAKAINWTG